MFSYRFDSAYGNCVWLFSGSTNTDDDYERYVESFVHLDKIATRRELPAGILFVDRESPMPNARWRKRMAEASASLRSRPLIAFASESPLVRGVVTAINWLRPPPFEFSVTSSFDDAVTWIEGKRGVGAKLFFHMMAELRAEQATLARPSVTSSTA
jgi:hypothetical protein